MIHKKAQWAVFVPDDLKITLYKDRPEFYPAKEVLLKDVVLRHEHGLWRLWANQVIYKLALNPKYISSEEAEKYENELPLKKRCPWSKPRPYLNRDWHQLKETKRYKALFTQLSVRLTEEDHD